MSSRNSRQQTANPVSLFPFLAVLICTMGTLILLLIVIARNTQVQMEESHVDVTVEKIVDLENETGMTGALIQGLVESRKKTEAQIEEERGRIATLEKQSEKLAKEIERTLKIIEQPNTSSDSAELAKLRETLREKQVELESLSEEYQKLHKEYTDNKKSYAVVPYRGPNGTYRRPIYIECTAEKVIVQPENIMLTEMDFFIASHPDNPLDAAIRAASQYYMERGLVQPGGEPYPLLLVRPDGISAYYAVRDALQSWNEDFGYELIDGEWSLEFPTPNEELKNEMTQQVNTARLRMQPMVNAMLDREMRMSGMNRSNMAKEGLLGSEPSGMPSMGIGGGVGGEGSLMQELANNRNGSPALNEPEMVPSSEKYAGLFSSQPSSEFADNRTTENTVPNIPGSKSRLDVTVQPSENSAMNNNLFARQQENATSQENPEVSVNAVWWSKNRPKPEVDLPVDSESFSEFSSSQQQRRPFERNPIKDADKPSKPLPKNWGVQNAGDGMTGIARSIPLTCYPDKLVFTKSGGKGIDREIPITQTVDAASRDFANSVWDYIDTWGDAGNRMYWRPNLRVTVAPGAESRFAELQTMLQGSGLKVKSEKYTGVGMDGSLRPQ